MSSPAPPLAITRRLVADAQRVAEVLVDVVVALALALRQVDEQAAAAAPLGAKVLALAREDGGVEVTR